MIVRLQSNGWIADETPFFITSRHERNILGNDNLPRIGIEIAQRQPLLPVNNISRPELCKLNTNSDTILILYEEYKKYLTELRKYHWTEKNTHFHSPFKPIQTKGGRIPLHLLVNVKMKLKRMEKEGHILKLNKCDEDCFISPIKITRKKEGSIKLALDSKLLNNQIFNNKYQKPNIHELIDNKALQLSSRESGKVWFNSLDLKNAYSQLQLCTDISKQCNFSIVGGETTGTYRFLTGFYGLGDMPNEFQRAMDSLLKDLLFTNCHYIDDILIASKGSLNEHKAILSKISNILDSKCMAVKWEKCAFFQREIEWLGFKISNSGVKPLVGKSDSIKSLPNPKIFPN